MQAQITTENVWFGPALDEFSAIPPPDGADLLPFDHHQLHGLVAPRGLLIIENTGQVWLGEARRVANNEARASTTAHVCYHDPMDIIVSMLAGDQSCWGSSVAGHKVYEALGVLDNMGASQRGGHNHCQFPAVQQVGDSRVFGDISS